MTPIEEIKNKIKEYKACYEKDVIYHNKHCFHLGCNNIADEYCDYHINSVITTGQK